MRTSLSPEIKDTELGQEADRILRSCVHCGFCNATCPTYQLLGDELDGPRGRIYQIKQLLEGQTSTKHTQLHLDRCLTCLACETTCPSGVRYGHLLDIGREFVEQNKDRGFLDRIKRTLLHTILPYPRRFNPLLRVARTLGALLSPSLRTKIPPYIKPGKWPTKSHQRTMLVLDGCVQPGLAPNINTATARVLSRLGVELKTIENAACCGAISHHLSKTEDAQAFMRKNIDAWWPHIEVGVEAIVITASGCGSFIKEYAYHLRNDRKYADKAKKISALSRDVSEVMSLLLDDSQIDYGKGRNVAFHAPCSLQHGQKINGVVEGLLERFGFILTPVADGHLCCGSAGTYSLLQSDLSQRLLTNKLIALQQNCPDVIATANIGCMSQLASKADVPVRHWVELIDEVLVTHGD